MAAGRAGDGGLETGCRLIRGLSRPSDVSAEMFWVFARSGDRARWAREALMFGGRGWGGGQSAGSARMRASAAR